MKFLTMEDLSIGQEASVTRTISESDVYLFAGVTGDQNPAHTNEVYASSSSFSHRIAHGMLTAGLVSSVLGMQLPGPGTIYLGQTLKFCAPVYIGDTITATVKVAELIPEKNRVILDTVCTNQDGKIVLSGQATVMPQKSAA